MGELVIRRSFYLIGMLSAALIIAPIATAKEHMIGGKSVNMVFTDTALATLATSACRGNARRVRELIASGVDPNGTGLDGAVPLLWAIHCQNIAGIEALLVAGADPNYTIPGRYNMVWQAATYSNEDILRLILNYGGEATTPKFEGLTAAERAIFLGFGKEDWDNYYLLLNSGLDINAADAVGTTIAIRLASASRWDKVLELLDHGYNYDLPTLGAYTQYSASSLKQDKQKLEVRRRLRSNGVYFILPGEN